MKALTILFLNFGEKFHYPKTAMKSRPLIMNKLRTQKSTRNLTTKAILPAGRGSRRTRRCLFQSGQESLNHTESYRYSPVVPD